MILRFKIIHQTHTLKLQLLFDCVETIKQNKFPLVAIVAVSQDFIIGDGNKMLWHLPNDLKRLKSITLGNPLIMGRKTFDSIGRPLPGRANIILTNQRNFKDNMKCEKYFVQSFEDAVIKANNWIIQKFEKNTQNSKKIFIFGGGEIYKLALSFCSKIELTLVDVNLKNGVSFPYIDEKKWEKKLIQQVKGNGSFPSHSFWIYNRKN